MAIDLESADTYFSGNVAASLWFAYTDEQRGNAVATAKAELSRALRRDLREDYSDAAYEPHDHRRWLRDDYAAFEQALHDLRRTPQSSPVASPPYPVAAEPGTADGAPYAYAYEQWSREALRWLGWTGASVVRA